MANGEIKSSLESDLAFEQAFLDAQIESFLNPELRADSVGAFFVSNRMPFIEQQDEEDED